MTFAEKLKSLRKQAGMSQERLAEKLGVSRQAVTKWETDTGIPELENMMAIPTLFGLSMDELLSNGRETRRDPGFLFESITEYDIDDRKHYEMKLGGASALSLSGYDGEKLRVRLASNTLSTLQSDFKVKIDDIRKRIDVDVLRRNGVTEAAAKKAVSIFIQVPHAYVGKLELSASAETIQVRSLECEGIELDVKAQSVALDGVAGTVEINCDLDMEIVCHSLDGAVELNQVSATSKIRVPEGTAFSTSLRGLGTSLSYERDGARAEAFDTPDADNLIGLNGMKSELVICALQKGDQAL